MSTEVDEKGCQDEIAEIAGKIFNKKPEEVTKGERRASRAVMHESLYGQCRDSVKREKEISACCFLVRKRFKFIIEGDGVTIPRVIVREAVEDVCERIRRTLKK